jgi:hypothetical protein
MIFKIIFCSIVFLATFGFLFFAARKFPVSETYYEKTETIIVNNP